MASPVSQEVRLGKGLGNKGHLTKRNEDTQSDVPVWKCPKVGMGLWHDLFQAALVSLKWAGEPCEPLTGPGTPLSGSPVSYWQEQETPPPDLSSPLCLWGKSWVITGQDSKGSPPGISTEYQLPQRSGPLVLSNILWDILTQEGLTISSTSHYKYKGDPPLYQSPCHLDAPYFDLLRSPLIVWCWFQISWATNPV